MCTCGSRYIPATTYHDLEFLSKEADAEAKQVANESTRELAYVVAPSAWDGTDNGFSNKPIGDDKALHAVGIFDQPSRYRSRIQLGSHEREPTSLDVEKEAEEQVPKPLTTTLHPDSDSDPEDRCLKDDSKLIPPRSTMNTDDAFFGCSRSRRPQCARGC